MSKYGQMRVFLKTRVFPLRAKVQKTQEIQEYLGIIIVMLLWMNLYFQKLMLIQNVKIKPGILPRNTKSNGYKMAKQMF